jgi:hypothetical protein
MSISAPKLQSTNKNCGFWEINAMWNHPLMFAAYYLLFTLTIGWLWSMAILYLL